MKREAIERLAMDSAAGELNEDVEALFREYLAEHPEARPDSEEMVRIYEETAAAIEAKTRNADAGGPAVKTHRLVHPNWRVFGRWAAALIVAVIIGFAGGRWPITGETSRIVFTTSARPAPQVKTISDLKEQYADTFWGSKALALMEDRAGQRYKGDFRDVSLWEQFRRYRKEQSDE
jgi:hypothetical protein